MNLTCVIAKSHFWVDLIFDALMMTVVLIGLQDYPWLYAIGKRVLKVLSLSPGFAAKRNEHFAYSKNAIVKRMNLESCRKDFMSYILENKQKKEIPVEELISHASILV